MSGSVNKVILIGRLGRDPELKYTPAGVAVCKFSMATDENWKDKAGEQQKHTEWHTIIAWEKLAKTCAEYLSKGKQVYIEGTIRSRKWEGKDGQGKTAHEIIARRMTMLGSRADGDHAIADGNGEQETAERPEIMDEDLPF